MGAPVGNTNAARGKVWRAAIERALERRASKGGNGINELADKLLEQAEAGDMAALKELGDRLDGKPAQAIGGDPEGAPVSMSVTWVPPARD